MRASFVAKEPESLEMELTMSMTLGQWNELREQLPDCYPSWKLATVISSMTAKATESFTEHVNVLD